MAQDWETLDRYLEQSNATPELKADVRAWREGRPAPRVTVAGRLPPIKVARVLTKLFEVFPHDPIETVRVGGVSG